MTLRTEQGTETVQTTSSTTYLKEQQPIQFSGLQSGDVIHVVGTPTATGQTPGTGTVAATAITVVEPTLAGRVQSINGSTYTLVGKDGRIVTVAVTGSTRYYSAGQQANASAISVGTHIHAEGTQDSLTSLNAADVIIDPATPR